jgi:predicted RNA-binding Zn-ribbon protein involved in translation (DUF1610 family)
MKNVHLMISFQEENHGDPQVCKSCDTRFQFGGKAKFCPKCGVEFNVFYDRKKKKHPYYPHHDRANKPRVRWSVKNKGEEMMERGDRKSDVLYIRDDTIETAEIFEESHDIVITCKMMNGPKGKLP